LAKEALVKSTKEIGQEIAARRGGALRRLGGEWVRTLAEQVCRDCGKLGCLIPVPHKAPEQRTGDEPV
jgi:hypothetical protein